MVRTLLLLAFLLLPLSASAQGQTAQPVVTGYMSLSGCPSAALTPCFVPYGPTGGVASSVSISQTTPGTTNGVVVNPVSGTPTETSVSCGTGSTTFLAAAAASTFILIKVPSAATVPVWFNFAGAAAVAAAPSVDLAAGASINWSAVNGFVPTAQINCLATSATTVTLVYK